MFIGFLYLETDTNATYLRTKNAELDPEKNAPENPVFAISVENKVSSCEFLAYILYFDPF